MAGQAAVNYCPAQTGQCQPAERAARQAIDGQRSAAQGREYPLGIADVYVLPTATTTSAKPRREIGRPTTTAPFTRRLPVPVHGTDRAGDGHDSAPEVQGLSLRGIRFGTECLAGIENSLLRSAARSFKAVNHRGAGGGTIALAGTPRAPTPPGDGRARLVKPSTSQVRQGRIPRRLMALPPPVRTRSGGAFRMPGHPGNRTSDHYHQPLRTAGPFANPRTCRDFRHTTVMRADSSLDGVDRGSHDLHVSAYRA
jgi:hypothetical protein